MSGFCWPALWLPILLAVSVNSSDILMVTMGGTKSHKMPFWELARGMISRTMVWMQPYTRIAETMERYFTVDSQGAKITCRENLFMVYAFLDLKFYTSKPFLRGHNITFISAFPPDFLIPGLEEIAPTGLVSYVRRFMVFDLVGAKMKGEEPVPVTDIMRYGYEACDAFLSDIETRSFISSRRNFDLIILDGAYPECALGLVYRFKIPFMYINTVGFYTMPHSNSGSPTPYSVTPFFGKGFTDNMTFLDRTMNAAWHLGAMAMHTLSVTVLQGVLRRHFGAQMPHVYDMSRNVSFILHNGHYSVTYPRPYLPNVAEVACIHCKEPKRLDPEIEEWIAGAGDAGFIYVSMGSSVRTSSMPLTVHRLIVNALGRLPQRVLWKQDAEQNMTDIPSNVRLHKWLPQQDLLGHPKIRAFVTHGGLLSMFETVYHGVPIVTIPVFCDHDSNAAKAETDGYAKKIELRHLTSDKLYQAIAEVITEPKYKIEVKKRQLYLRDQKESPLERAIYWTEYVLRHKGAYHLQSPAKDLTFFQYYMFDVVFFVILILILSYVLISYAIRLGIKKLAKFLQSKQILDKPTLIRSKILINHSLLKKKKL